MKAGKGRKKAKFILQLLLAPFKALCNAADLYVKTMNNCQGMVGGYAMAVNSTHTQLSSFNRHPYADNCTVGKRIVTRKKVGSKGEDEIELRRRLIRAGNNKVMKKCYSFDIGKMGRIDEEEPCSFSEDDSFSSSDDLAKQRLHRNWLIQYVMARDAEEFGNQ